MFVEGRNPSNIYAGWRIIRSRALPKHIRKCTCKNLKKHFPQAVEFHKSLAVSLVAPENGSDIFDPFVNSHKRFFFVNQPL